MLKIPVRKKMQNTVFTPFRGGGQIKIVPFPSQEHCIRACLSIYITGSRGGVILAYPAAGQLTVTAPVYFASFLSNQKYLTTSLLPATSPTVLILVGNTEINAHLRSNLRYLICFSAFD